MIMTTSPEERAEALARLLPYQRADFEGLFRAMDGLPVIIRLIDPPLHEFLPSSDDLTKRLIELKVQEARGGKVAGEIREVEDLLARVAAMHEANPMLGTRGVRLGITMPDLTRMQVRAVFEAACGVAKEGVKVHPEVMIPLVSHVNELKLQRSCSRPRPGR